MAFEGGRFLVVHTNPERSAQIRQLLEAHPNCTVEVIDSGMDSIAGFSSFMPDRVIVEGGLQDIPVPVLVTAFREMSPAFQLWLCAEELSPELQAEARECGARDSLIMPFTLGDLERLAPLEKEEQSKLDESTMHGEDSTMNASDLDSWWELKMAKTKPLVMDVKELERHRHFKHEGSLKITGHLNGMEMLEVDGPLTIIGDITASNIRCSGSLSVKGAVRWCRAPGIFVRGMVDVAEIQDSVVVCGANLVLEESCCDSQVYVLQNLTGRSETSCIEGGRAVVGEHLDIARVGNADHALTTIELAPELLRPSWVLAKRRLWNIASHRKTRPDDESRFLRDVNSPSFFRELAGLNAREIHPFLMIKIGDHEDLVFEHQSEPVRMFLAANEAHRQGIRMVPARGAKGST